MSQRLLIVVGGAWHDFDGFAGAMRSLLTPAGYEVDVTYDFTRLERLGGGGAGASAAIAAGSGSGADVDVILDYTCMSPDKDGRTPAPGMTEPQVRALTLWVRAGGALLAAHAATVMGESPRALGALLGGVFVSHPPAKRFIVYPVSRAHPITAGLEAFKVHDELYIQQYDPSVEIHMVAVDDGVAHPMVWSKVEGAGRVAHVALGHDQAVWSNASYQRLMLQALAWVGAAPTRPSMPSI